MRWKSLFILFIFSSLWLSVGANPISPNAKEIYLFASGEPFKNIDTPMEEPRSMVFLPFSAYLNDDSSIDLEFYQAIGEVEIVVSKNGEVVYSSTENITSSMLKAIPLPHDLSGQCLLEVKGKMERMHTDGLA